MVNALPYTGYDNILSHRRQPIRNDVRCPSDKDQFPARWGQDHHASPFDQQGLPYGLDKALIGGHPADKAFDPIVKLSRRNRLNHAYFDIDLDRVWDTIIDDLPPRVTELERNLRNL